MSNKYKENRKRIIKQIIFENISANTLLDINIKKLKCMFPLHYHYLKHLGYKSLEDIKILKTIEKNTFPQNEIFMKLFDERIKFFENLNENKKINFKKLQMYPKLCELYDENELKKALKYIL